MPPPLSIAEAVRQSVEHAERSVEMLSLPTPPDFTEDELLVAEQVQVARAMVHATLAEAYARLASAMVVNATSMHAALEAQGEGRRGD